MYCEFYGLRERPFNVTADPKFLYLNACYREALASLHYGITQRKGFITLIGEAGTGKTTLLKKLMDDLDENTRTVFIFNTNVSFDEILEYVFHEMDLPVHTGKRLYMLQRLNDFLLDELRQGRNVALLIDEAQDLDYAVMEDLRLLSNLETAKEKILQIVLSGQPELGQKLGNTSLRQLRQRVAINCRLQPLSPDEVAEYIQARLTAAGCADPRLFSRDAEARIYEISRGIPRIVNVVCDNAMVIGYALGKKRLGADVINEAAADLFASGQLPEGETPAGAPPPEAPRTTPARRRTLLQRPWVVVQAALAIIVALVLVGLVGRSLMGREQAPNPPSIVRRPLVLVPPGHRAEPAELVRPAERAQSQPEAAEAAPPRKAPGKVDSPVPGSETQEAIAMRKEDLPSTGTGTVRLPPTETHSGPAPVEGGLTSREEPVLPAGSRTRAGEDSVPQVPKRSQWLGELPLPEQAPPASQAEEQVAAQPLAPPPKRGQPAQPAAVPAPALERPQRVQKEKAIAAEADKTSRSGPAVVAAPPDDALARSPREAPPPEQPTQALGAAPAQPPSPLEPAQRHDATAVAALPRPATGHPAPPPGVIRSGPTASATEAPAINDNNATPGGITVAVPHGDFVTVQPGDSLSQIAIRKYGQASYTALDVLKLANPAIQDIDVISVGQRIQTPPLVEGLPLLREENGNYALLVLSSPHQRRVNALGVALSRKGFRAEVRRTNFGPRRTVYRLLVPGFSDRDAALKAADTLKRLFREDEELAAAAR